MSNFLKKLPGEKLLYYSDQVDGFGKQVRVYYLRKHAGDTDTDICLQTSKLTQAKNLRDAYLVARVSKKLGLLPVATPAPAPAKVLVTECLDVYQQAGHPTIRKGRKKHPGKKHQVSETRSVESLRDGLAGVYVDDLDAAKLDVYRKWREEQCRKGADGDRSTDLDLTCLSNALQWCVRSKIIPSNPIASRMQYYNPAEAKKAKDSAPKSTEELHDAARIVFEDPRSETAGWLWLFESFSGMRSEESSLCGSSPKTKRRSATLWAIPCTFGGLERTMWTGTCCTCMPGLNSLLEAHAIWHKNRFPDSPWMFPGRLKKGSGKGETPIERSVNPPVGPHACHRSAETQIYAATQRALGMSWSGDHGEFQTNALPTNCTRLEAWKHFGTAMAWCQAAGNTARAQNTHGSLPQGQRGLT